MFSTVDVLIVDVLEVDVLGACRKNECLKLQKNCFMFPGSFDGHWGFEALPDRSQRPLRVQHRRDPHGRDSEEVEPRDDALHRRLKDLHHSGDHHQRNHRQAVVLGEGQRCKQTFIFIFKDCYRIILTCFQHNLDLLSVSCLFNNLKSY